MWLVGDMIPNILSFGIKLIDGIDKMLVQVNKDDVVVDIAMYVIVKKVDGHFYVKHNLLDNVVKMIESRLKK